MAAADSNDRAHATSTAPLPDAARLFDVHATAYRDTVDHSIAASGEDTVFFAHRKVTEVRRWWARKRRVMPTRVLDFGCGTGVSTVALREGLGDETQVTGYDVSPESISVARAQFSSPGIDFLHGSREELPFAAATFEAVFTANVFHHIDRAQHRHWIRELRRVTRPDGVVFVFEHNPANPLTVRAVRSCPFDDGVELLPPGYTRALFRVGGLHAERARYYFFFPAPLRALRRLEPWLDRVPLGAQYFVVGHPEQP